MTREKFNKIVNYIKDVIAETEFEGRIYVVGGTCRNLYMGREIKDIDIVIDLPDGGVKFANWCKKKGYTGTVVIFQTYGTAAFKLYEFPDDDIECVMTRGEKYLDDGSRNPVVEFCSLQEDAIRRDFTMNALYYNVSTCGILDMVNGRQDIDDCIIRTTNPDPDFIFKEDPLRILRAVRFSCEYDFSISQNTYAAMVRNSDRLKIITKERIQSELNRILLSSYAAKGIDILHNIGAMKYIVPDFDRCYGLEQNEYHIGDVAEHSLAVLEHHCDVFRANLPERLACFLHDIGKIYAKSVKNGKVHFYDHEHMGAELSVDILRSLKYDTETIKEVRFLIRNHMRTKQAGNGGELMKDKSLNKLLYECKTKERFMSLLRVIESDNMSHKKEHNIQGQFSGLLTRVEQSPQHMKMFGYKLPVDGNDIMEALKIEPGEIINEINRRLLNQAFMNPDITRDECIKILPGIRKEAETYIMKYK